MKYMIQTGMLGAQILDEGFSLAKQLGFDALELTSYGGKTLEELVAEAALAAERYGIAARALCGGYRGWIGHFDEEKRAMAVNDIGKAMKICADVGIQGIIAPAAYGMHSNCLPPHRAPRTAQEDRAVLVDSLLRIAESAEKHETLLYLEPLNRYEDHMLNTLEAAMDLIKAVDCKNIRLMLDLFHGSIEEASLAVSAGKYASFIGHVHLADSNRLLPGQGHTDFRSVFNALKANGFDGYLSYECGFPGKRDKAKELADSLNYLKTLDN